MENKRMSLMCTCWSVLVVAAILVMFVSANCVQATISCNEAITTMLPCKPFLVDGADKPSPPCCLGLKTIKDRADTKKNRQEICECFKKASPAMGVDPIKAEDLPQLCGVQLSFPFKPDVDCTKVG